MLQRCCLIVAVFLALTSAMNAQPANLKFPKLHQALHELREARKELKDAPHEFGGHRAKALRGVEDAIKQIEAALIAADDNVKSASNRKPESKKKYQHNPGMHYALDALKDAREELKNAKHAFNGRRVDALRDVNFAMVQIELALKHAKKS